MAKEASSEAATMTSESQIVTMVLPFMRVLRSDVHILRLMQLFTFFIFWGMRSMHKYKCQNNKWVHANV